MAEACMDMELGYLGTRHTEKQRQLIYAKLEKKAETLATHSTTQFYNPSFAKLMEHKKKGDGVQTAGTANADKVGRPNKPAKEPSQGKVGAALPGADDDGPNDAGDEDSDALTDMGDQSDEEPQVKPPPNKKPKTGSRGKAAAAPAGGAAPGGPSPPLAALLAAARQKMSGA